MASCRTTAAGAALLALLSFALPAPAPASPVQVFATDFESGLPAEITAPGSVITPVQDFAGLGPGGRQFGGSFLRYTSVPIFPTTLTLRNLPPHDHLSVKFLLGLIDSWDGTELMQISVDGVMKFNHWFQLATGDTTDYAPAPPGAILRMGTDLGFSGCCYYNRDRAYDLGVDPAFLDIPHTADSVTVVWSLSAVSGPAAAQWQGGDDESWAIDAVRVEVDQQNVGVVPGLAAGGLALAPPSPNPARAGALRLRITLPSNAPATLDLLDVAGRRVAGRDVGALGAGEHDVSLTTQGVAPGFYFARLKQGVAGACPEGRDVAVKFDAVAVAVAPPATRTCSRGNWRVRYVNLNCPRGQLRPGSSSGRRLLPESERSFVLDLADAIPPECDCEAEGNRTEERNQRIEKAPELGLIARIHTERPSPQ